MNYKLLGSTVIGVIIIGALLYLCFYITSEKEVLALNIANLILGVAIGWLVGVLLSPYGTEESKQFSAYAKAISLFISGYLIGKLDKLLEMMLSPDFLVRTIPAFRGMSFITATIVAMLITFVYRRYA